MSCSAVSSCRRATEEATQEASDEPPIRATEEGHRGATREGPPGGQQANGVASGAAAYPLAEATVPSLLSWHTHKGRAQPLRPSPSCPAARRPDGRVIPRPPSAAPRGSAAGAHMLAPGPANPGSLFPALVSLCRGTHNTFFFQRSSYCSAPPMFSPQHCFLPRRCTLRPALCLPGSHAHTMPPGPPPSPPYATHGWRHLRQCLPSTCAPLSAGRHFPPWQGVTKNFLFISSLLQTRKYNHTGI